MHCENEIQYQCDEADEQEGAIGPEDILGRLGAHNLAFEIPGALHIVNNAARDLGDHMAHFETWLKDAGLMSTFLRQRWNREWFVAACLDSDEGEPWARKLEHFTASLVDWRFSACLDVANALKDIRPCITQFWRQHSLASHSGKDKAKKLKNGEQVDIAALTRIAESQLFWQYNELILVCFECLHHITNWMEACPCHPRSLYGAGQALSYYSKRRRFQEESASEQSCRRKGRRAPELAGGYMEDVLERAVDMRSGTVVVLASVLPPHERSILFNDWVSGRDFIWYILRLKSARRSQIVESG